MEYTRNELIDRELAFTDLLQNKNKLGDSLLDLVINKAIERPIDETYQTLVDEVALVYDCLDFHPVNPDYDWSLITLRKGLSGILFVTNRMDYLSKAEYKEINKVTSLVSELINDLDKAIAVHT